MPKFTLRQLEYFRAVAMNGSISAAAEQERVSRSALASGLDELERGLDCRLFLRHKAHGMVLTPVGEQILLLARDLLDEARELESAASGGELGGVLTIGCFTSLGPTLLPRLFEYFRIHHPNVTLRTYTEPVDRLTSLLRSGEIELAVSYELAFEPDLQTEALYPARIHAILPPDHPLAAGSSVKATDLVEEPLILLDVPPSPATLRHYFEALDLVPHIAHRFTNFEVIRSLVARGIGYSIAIQRPAVDKTYEGLDVVPLPLDPPPPEEFVYCGWLAEQRLSATARVALDALRQVARPDPRTQVY
jgi:DNA-binding transcriptional LysR family regulator